MSLEKNKILKATDDVLEKATKIYSSNLDLRNSICQIPIIGYALDAIFIDLGKQYYEKRVIQVIQLLREEMFLIEESIEESKVDKEFLETEEFFDLVIRIMEYSVKTRQREKVRLNCSILAGSILIENKDLRNSAEDLLILIRDLSPIDLKVAKEIYKQQENKPDKFDDEGNSNFNELHFVDSSGWDKLPGLCKLEVGDFRLALTKLSNAGLIKEIVGSYSSYMGGKYIITSTFKDWSR